MKSSPAEHIQVTASINITASVAKRLVNIELMKKVGQMIIAGNPDLLVDGEKIGWKVPLLVVSPPNDSNTYFTGEYALMNALSGVYVLDTLSIKKLRLASDPLIDRLYPQITEWIQKVEEAKTQ